MAKQNETEQNTTQSGDSIAPTGLDKIITRLPVPPKYRTRWFFLGVGVALLLLIVLYQCNATGGASNQAPPVAPVPVATPTPEPTPIPREEYRLPSQYAFVHFVNEMAAAACYDQHDQPATLEVVEADIMHDVPMAVSTLLRLYADNACEEVEPWHQIPGRAGWMLRASGVNEHLPQPEIQEEEPK